MASCCSAGCRRGARSSKWGAPAAHCPFLALHPRADHDVEPPCKQRGWERKQQRDKADTAEKQQLKTNPAALAPRSCVHFNPSGRQPRLYFAPCISIQAASLGQRGEISN